MNKMNTILSDQKPGKRTAAARKKNPVNARSAAPKRQSGKKKAAFTIGPFVDFLRKTGFQKKKPSVFIIAGSIISLVLAALLVLSFIAFPKQEKPDLSDQDIFLQQEKSDEVGTGYTQIKRDTDIEYTIKKKDTLYELAYLYDVDVDQLIVYNRIEDVTRLMPGQTILIPSKDNAEKLRIEQKMKEETARLAAAKKPVSRPKSVLPASLLISSEQQSDGQTLTVNFKIDTEIDADQHYSYIWDFGDSKKAFHQTTRYTYTKPGTYNVALTMIDKYGYRKVSNRLFIDIPHTGTTKNTNYEFITMNNVGGTFSAKGPITSINGQAAEDSDALTLVSKSPDKYLYKAEKTGYFFLVIETRSAVQKISLFVSPVPSVHADRTDINWYRTQFNTGMPSNCGPAAASMLISWATGNYVPVATIRQEVGWSGVGGTSMNDLGNSIRKHGGDFIDQNISQVEDIFGMIDKGHVVMILHHCGRITSRGENPASTFFGRYYKDSVGHYIIIKGYSVDKKYFVVYDPLPGDWVSNSVRYSDGISNLGRNRYYPVSEIKRSIRSNRVIEMVR